MDHFLSTFDQTNCLQKDLQLYLYIFMGGSSGPRLSPIVSRCHSVIVVVICAVVFVVVLIVVVGPFSVFLRFSVK